MAVRDIPLGNISAPVIGPDGRLSPELAKFLQRAQSLLRQDPEALDKLLVGSPTGGDKGAGTINADGLYDDGSRVLTERAGQTIEAGFDNEPYSIGAVTTGTVTIDPINGQHQTLTNNGAFVLSPATVSNYATVSLHITNDSSAGAVTFTGWEKKYPSGSLTTTDTEQFNIVMYFFGSAGADYAIFARQ